MNEYVKQLGGLMQRVIEAEAEPSRRLLGHTCVFPEKKPATDRRFAVARRVCGASGLALLAALAFSTPLQAQGLSLIQSAQAGVAAPRAPASACDDQAPECQAAKKALAKGLRAQMIADTPAAPHAPADAFGGLPGDARRAPGADDGAIRFGLIAPFTGANKDFAGELKLGVETAFAVANDAGGVAGKPLRLVVADDGYDPARTPDLARLLVEKDHVFGFVSNFGTATSAAILPYVLEHKLTFVGAFSGGGVLRRNPPDRYVFNYRASYAEETEAVVRYLVKVRRLAPEQIAVFAQDDAFGDAGYAGVEKAIRALDETGNPTILHMRYARNSIDVASAMDDLKKHHDNVTTTVRHVRERVASAKPTGDNPDAKPHAVYRDKTVRVSRSEAGIKAVVMVATYRAAAKFIEKSRDLYPDMIFTDVSAVGSNNFADELKLLGPRYSKDIIVTQVVPDPDGYSSIALEYKSALAKYYPAEHPDYVSFESYLNAKIMLEGLKKAGPQPDSDKLVTALEGIHGMDLGLGSLVNFGASEHQAVHKVWGTQLDDQGKYHFIDLE